MPPRITPEQKETFWRWTNKGASVAEASRRAGISDKTAYGWVRRRAQEQAGLPLSPRSGDEYRQSKAERHLSDPIPFEQLSPEAREAWENFEYFRVRYMGHISTPWQVETALIILALWEQPDREYLVENVAPGLGKSTLLVDIAAWLTVRDRAIRGLFISRAQTLAERNVLRLRRLLERTSPVKAKPEHIDQGIAVDAVSTLAADFGRFRPATSGDVWKKDEFVVVQADGTPIEEKEPTWSAFGFDSEWIGNRFDLLFGDDLDTSRSTRSADVVANNRETFDNELEPRLEPAGLMVVCQQRLGPFDFSGHCLEKRVVPDDDGSGEDNLGDYQYRHVVYKAHDDTFCRGRETHRSDAVPWTGDTDGGCLLDPRRLGWRDLRKKMVNPQRFQVVYQQEDLPPEEVLVDPIWVTGGVGRDGVEYIGCWDNDRKTGEVPWGLTNPLSIVTVDPSPTKMWGIIWWLYNPHNQERLIVDLQKRKLGADDFLSINPNTGAYTGLAVEWQERSKDLGVPIRTWIIEKTGVNHFLMKYAWAREWFKREGCVYLPHDTQRTNKNDPEFGIQTVANVWRSGLVRLPGSQVGDGRMRATKLVDEATRYPHVTSDDLLHAQWFLEFNLPNLIPRTNGNVTPLRRPSWLRAS